MEEQQNIAEEAASHFRLRDNFRKNGVFRGEELSQRLLWTQPSVRILFWGKSGDDREVWFLYILNVGGTLEKYIPKIYFMYEFWIKLVSDFVPVIYNNDKQSYNFKSFSSSVTTRYNNWNFNYLQKRQVWVLSYTASKSVTTLI